MRALTLHLLVCVALAGSCNKLIKVNTSLLSCSFNFIPFGSSCDEYKFNYCQISYCQTSETIQNCSAFDTFNEFDFDNCFRYCCKNSLDSASNYGAASTCMNKQAKSSTKQTASNLGDILIVVTSVFCATAVIIGIGFCVYRRSNSLIRVAQQSDNPEATKNQIKPVNEQASLQEIVSRRWRDSSIKLDQHPNCSICLSERPNLQVRCGHFFHPECLRMWLKKKFECGVCRGGKLISFQLTCHCCFKKETRLTIEDLVRMKRMFSKIVCSDCTSP